MASFENVLSIITTRSNSDERGLLKLTIAGSSEVNKTTTKKTIVSRA